ncbi:MAG: hypothetical protein CR996_00745 [Draconibacterium sp.]|nr:MAG: hypothetical protein CR996_00745 [Draconibacterium sp.]PIF05634.1 MAG: hypothetical protein CSA36_05520 [Draconibacterium sp.]
MKKVITLLAAVLLSAIIWAQTPEKMSYQAVVRNSENNLVINTQVGMQISILESSIYGASVYVETQTPTTNANGLVSIEIGGGIVVNGSFSTIDWSNDTYFIKTETDPTGGNNYSITGVSQLLSVPYALHAKTAEAVTGGITETDPVYSSSEAANITATDITNLGNLSGTNTGDQDISGIATNEQAIQDTASQIRADMPTVTSYSVGDFAQGGIVFWVDETGQHGLVAAKEDQSTGVRWYAGSYGKTQAKGDGPFAGEANTSIIIAVQAAIGDDGGTYAARICNELQITVGDKTYGDWYLPSKEELNLMYQNKATIDATAGVNGGSSFAIGPYYWCSSEWDVDGAWIQNFYNGSQTMTMKYYTARVRAVRAF